MKILQIEPGHKPEVKDIAPGLVRLDSPRTSRAVSRISPVEA